MYKVAILAARTPVEVGTNTPIWEHLNYLNGWLYTVGSEKAKGPLQILRSLHIAFQSDGTLQYWHRLTGKYPLIYARKSFSKLGTGQRFEIGDGDRHNFDLPAYALDSEVSRALSV